MLLSHSELTFQLQAAYLGVKLLVESAPLNDEQVHELEERVRTFWKLALQLSESPRRRQFED